MAARIRKVKHDDATREKIKTSQLVNRLTDHAFGKVELQPTQVRAIEILLKKTMPDLAQTTSTVTHIHDTSEMSDAQLADIAAGRGPRTVATQDSSEEPSQVH